MQHCRKKMLLEFLTFFRFLVFLLINMSLNNRTQKRSCIEASYLAHQISTMLCSLLQYLGRSIRPSN